MDRSADVKKQKRTATSHGPDPIDLHVGAMLRQRRRELKQSQAALGEALGLTFQQVQKYEKGWNRISASTLHRAAQAQSVEVSYYFAGLGGARPTDNPPPSDVAKWLQTDEAWLIAAAFTQLPDASKRAVATLVRSLPAK